MNQQSINKEKNWTGERLETFILNNNTIEHLHRYALATNIVNNKVVLDIASGEGYGSNLLAKSASKVFGVDIHEATIEEAKKKYQRSNLEFRQGTADLIPLADNSVDVVVSFETLEHHDKHEEMFLEIKRVLKEDGVLIMSTPDKRYYTDEGTNKNVYHIKELYFDEFEKLVKNHFSNCAFYFQNMFSGSLILPQKTTDEFTIQDGSYEYISAPHKFIPLYILTIASSSQIPSLGLTGFSDDTVDHELLERKENEVRKTTIDLMRKSWNYRLGRFLLTPTRFFRKK